MLTTEQTIEVCELLDRASDLVRTAPLPTTAEDRERLVGAAVANVDATVSMIARARQGARLGWERTWTERHRAGFEPTEPPPDDPEPEPDDD